MFAVTFYQFIRKTPGRNLFVRIAALAAVLLVTGWMAAQTSADGSITGTVQDASGAVVPNAVVIAKNVQTGVETSRTSSGSGVYQVGPLIAGTYSVTVTASGFQTFRQENIVLNAGQQLGLNATMAVGNASETVTVTSAPPQLDTANATLGGTITSDEFLQLPLLVSNNQQRDITTFSNLLPGAQVGSRSSLFSGTANRVQEVYLDGVPLTTISQIGDNRPIFNLVPAEAVGQIGVTTSGASVAYQGAGSVNYNLKSGTNGYHGSVADFVRNTIFDTWGFTAPAVTVPRVQNGAIVQVPAGKPIDHQNELTATIGGPVRIPHLFNGQNRMFFFAGYDRVHTRSAPAYSTGTVPTSLMRQGDFTQLITASAGNPNPPGYVLYDPTTATCIGNTCTRQPFMGMKNGVATTNVIPAGEISPIAKTMQSFLPAATNDTLIQNNYLGGNPSGYDNWLYSVRLDYTVSPKQTISGVVTGGNRKAYPFTSNALSSVPSAVFPIPYIGTTYTTVAGHWADISDTYTITPQLVNEFKFGFSNFGGPPARNVTQGVAPYEAVNMGIGFNNVPADGQALTEFPTNVFAGSNEPTQWGAGSTGQSNTTVSETYTGLDNVLWVKGKHSLTFGAQFQWLEDQQSSYDGPTSTITLNYNVNETAQENGTSYVSGTGYSYASYLMGAVDTSALTVQPFSVLGGRYRTFAPYVEDDYKVTSKLTLNLGLRWDYLPVYQEAVARYSFLNPTLANPVTGNAGALQFAGHWGGASASCGCASPAESYKKNWGPRIGFAYAPNDKMVVRGAYSVVYSHGGGTGGAGGAATGPSQLGFNVTDNFPATTAGPGAGPVFYLNNSGYNAQLNNSTFGGPGHLVPSPAAPSVASLSLNTGNTVSGSGSFVTPGGAPGYEDPYLSGRAPEFEFWNFGIERQLMQDMSITVNYAGSQSHFIAGAANLRGLQSGQINPIYYALGTTLTLPATQANLATANTKAQAAGIPAVPTPYAGFTAAAATTSGAGQATIYRALTWMPQYSGTTDTWGSQTANSSYHALQISLAKRMSHGLTFNLNYTYSRNIDDAGTQRSGWALPASVMLNNVSWPQNRIDRGLSANSVPQNLAAYGVWSLPFGKGKLGGENMLTRQVLGGWQLSGVFTYDSGAPLAITSTSCSTSFQPTAGTCMPDLNPAFQGKTVRQNGSWGAGMTAKTLGTTRYVNGYISSTSYVGTQGVDSSGAACGTNASSPFCNVGQFKIGDAPRTAAFGLRAPGVYNLNMSVRRTFNLTPERVKFILGVDCQNVTNKVTFGGIGTSINNASFGTVTTATSNSGSRDFQFSGRVNF